MILLHCNCWNDFLHTESECVCAFKVVFGEIYYVDDKFMAQLDDFEGFPDLYQRDIIRICIKSHAEHESSVEVKGKQEFVECNAYLLKNFDEDLLDKETYSSYDSLGPHGKPYQPE